ncbi:hypothetical protein Tco_0700492 [Tanacetum coccineum]
MSNKFRIARIVKNSRACIFIKSFTSSASFWESRTDEPKRKPKAKQNQARNGKDKVKGVSLYLLVVIVPAGSVIVPAGSVITTGSVIVPAGSVIVPAGSVITTGSVIVHDIYLVMAISVISISSDSSEDSVGTPAGRVILFETPIIAPTIPPSPDYTPASPDYSPASDSESDPSSDHIPPLPAISPFLSSDDDTTDSDTPDTPPSPTHGTPFTEITAST